MLHDFFRRLLRLAATLLALTAGCKQLSAEEVDSFPSTQQSVFSGEEGTWSATGRMSAGRILHTAIRLPDGRVLAVGGYSRSVELYDPASGVWSRAADALNTHRAATATLLLNGKVLIAGAGGDEWKSATSAALYDSASSTWTPAGSLGTPRFHHAAALLADGRVLVMGGADRENGGNALASAELYDPLLDVWTPTASMATARRNHTATLLEDGRVLVTGGTGPGGALQNSAEVYDPTTGTWSPVEALAVARASHSATRLVDGRVLVAGGGDSTWESSASVEVFDPGNGSWTAAAPMARPRRDHSATLLPTGQVLVTGGFHEYTGILTAAELYDATRGSWRSAGAMAASRYLHTATLLANGQVLVAGGFSNGDQASTELYSPARAAPESPTEPGGTSLLLQVVDTAGNPIPTAAVSAQGAVFPTDGSGHILFENLPAGRFLARVDALGFASASAVVELHEGAHAGAQVMLHPLSESFSFQAEQGGVIETERVRVTIPPGSVVDALGRPVTGTVEVTIVPLDPTTQLATLPGPLEGVTSARGDTVSLESFFMADVSLWSQGAPAQLAPGASATLEFVLPESVTGHLQVGDTVPAWWFDLDAGLWREEGSGTVRPSETLPGRLAWVVTVHHFTWWNCDAPWTEKSCINLHVVDGLGRPVANAQVSAEGYSYAGSSLPKYTNAAGRTCIEVKRGHAAKVFVGVRGKPDTLAQIVTGSEQAGACGASTCTSVTIVKPDLICTPGAYRTCPYSGPAGTLGQGLCRAGRQQCGITGTEWSACVGEVKPVTESCRTPFDDDCDGTVNEDCTCSSQEGVSCYTGPTGTQGVGICRGGAIGCDLFGNATCVGQQLPRTETCSTLADDDCDGSNECTPTLLRLQKWGGAGNERARGLSIDGEGNVVLLGRPDGTLEVGGTVLTGDPSDLFVLKLDAHGNPLWSRLIQREQASSQSWEDGDARVTTDAAGNVLIVGSFQTSLHVDGLTLTNSGTSSAFVIKLSPTGSLLWARSFGGQGGAWANGLATGANGNLVMIGTFHGTLRLGDTEYSDFTWGNDLFVVKLDANTGAPLWSNRYWGEVAEIADVSLDAAENVLVAGTFYRDLDLNGMVLRSPNTLQTPFVVKLDGATGTTLGGKAIGEGYGRRLRVDAAGNRWLLTWHHQGWAVLWKLDPSGAPLWNKPFPYTALWIEPQLSLTIDGAGNALLAGWFGETVTHDVNGFLLWYGANGEQLMDKVFEGWHEEEANAFSFAMGMGAAIDSDGNVLFTGWFQGPLDFGTGPVQAQGSDVFLLKVDPTP